MTKHYSYCLVGDPEAVKATKTIKEPLLSGLWQWHLAFNNYGKKGEVRLIRTKEDIEEYDILHINMTGGNLPLPQMYREILGNSSSTNIVVNVDFDIGSWGKDWQYPTILENALQAADFVFHVESVGASVLEHALERPVATLPHPVDIKGLDEYKKIDREPYIVNIHHRYEQDITLPYWAIRDLPMHKVLLGYHKGTVAPLPMYDQTFGHIPFLDAIDIMSKAKFGLDLFHRRNYGRTIIEFAALAIPCVCSETIDASHRCFPDLVVNPFDTKRVNELFWEMINNDDFYQEVFKKAYSAAEYYSQKECYERMVEALEDEEERIAISGAEFQETTVYNARHNCLEKGKAISDANQEEVWKQIQSRYEKKTNMPKSKGWMKFLIQRGNQFKAFIGVKGLVLDVGCGNGRYLGKSYEESGYVYIDPKNQIIGLDPLDSYEERFPVINASGEKIPLQDNIFDAVVLATSIDHIVTPTRMLKEVKRVLKPEGSVFIWSAVMSDVMINPGHLHTWTDTQIVELLERIFKIKTFTILKSKKGGNQIFIEGVKNE